MVFIISCQLSVISFQILRLQNYNKKMKYASKWYFFAKNLQISKKNCIFAENLEGL